MKKHGVAATTLLQCKRFLTLNNAGGILVLYDKEGKLMDKCNFNPLLHATLKPIYKGISLEKRAPELASKNKENWTSSLHATGGTPGLCNSIVPVVE